MSGGMPVLGEDDMFELLTESIDDRNDLIAIFNCESSSWAEVVLEVDNKKRVGRLGGDGHS